MALQVHTTLEPHGPATAIVLTDEQVERVGGGKRAAVRVTIGGRQSRLRLGVMGGINMIGLSKAARAELGVEIGDEIDATVELDADTRTVAVPDDLRAALARSGVEDRFDARSFTYRKEAARGVADAKRPETRQRRIDKIVAELS